ncbi:MAG: aminotransferase class V-fold PLP-dependent enzyme [Woeseiaceae bacterium]|nr:aminotransferase class V-fold PLP-dependent enzyme [Woeseiaceae bacterium]
MIDIASARADTPAAERILHFNNAGASLMPTPVYEAVLEHLALEREIGGYEAESIAAEAAGAFYTEFAALLNCRSSEIAYVENATRAWDMAFYSIPFKAGDRVLTHGSEYSSNFLALLQQRERCGIEIDIAPSDASGQVDVDALEARIRPETRLIALTHIPTQGGLVNPAEAVGDVARRHGILFLLDACQSVGQIDLDVERIGCQMLSGTGRKFLRGPRGTGFLYVSDDVVDTLDPVFIDMRAADWVAPDRYRFKDGARRFETWESYVAGRVGLARAVRYARELGLDSIEERVASLAATLRTALAGLPGVTVHDLGERRSGIVTFQKGGESPEDTAARLREMHINVSYTNRLSAQIDFGERGIDSLVRASVHYFNTEEEIERFAASVAG